MWHVYNLIAEVCLMSLPSIRHRRPENAEGQKRQR